MSKSTSAVSDMVNKGLPGDLVLAPGYSDLKQCSDVTKHKIALVIAVYPTQYIVQGETDHVLLVLWNTGKTGHIRQALMKVVRKCETI